MTLINALLAAVLLYAFSYVLVWVYDILTLFVAFSKIRSPGEYQPGKSIFKIWREACNKNREEPHAINLCYPLVQGATNQVVRQIRRMEEECYKRPWAFERIEGLVAERKYHTISLSSSPELAGYLLYREEEIGTDSMVTLIRILRFGIGKKYRGSGNGRILLCSFIAIFSSQKRILIELPEDGNEDQALIFLKTIGFKESSRHRFPSKTPWGTGSITLEYQRKGVLEEQELQGF